MIEYVRGQIDVREELFEEKLSIISLEEVHKNIEDIYDLYSLSKLEGYEINNIIRVQKYKRRKLGSFEEFISNISEIEYSYNKLKGIVNKPSFEEVYGRVRDFCLPFITGDYKKCNGRWSPKMGMWYQIW